MTTIATYDFETPIGLIQTLLQTDQPVTVVKAGNNSITTLGHKVRLESFELLNEWLPDTMSFETSKGWRWFVTKTNNHTEKLRIYCKLIAPKEGTKWGHSSGEYLDSIEIENKTHQLHIGTEDTDSHWARSIQNDWMPKRYENELGLHRKNVWSLTEYIDFGFKTKVPNLNETEKIYFHFLVATNMIKPSVEHPNERDCSTWYAVEKSKNFLDKYLTTKNTAANKA